MLMNNCGLESIPLEISDPFDSAVEFKMLKFEN